MLSQDLHVIVAGALTQSPDYGEKDPARVQPRFQEHVDREHRLFKGHKKFLDLLERDELQGHREMYTFQSGKSNWL